MKKLHMGTMSYGSDSMDEVAHQLAVAFGLSGEQGEQEFFYLLFQRYFFLMLYMKVIRGKARW